MVDTNQIFIIAAITVMTIILSIIGVQLIFVLRDLRQLIQRANSITAHLEKFGINVDHGYHEVLGFVVGMKKILTVVDHISEKKGIKHEKR